jgi:hypothetical protein
MSGIIKVDRVQSDSNLAFNIAGANVAFMDASALRLVGSSIVANGTTIVSGSKVVNSAMPTGSVIQVVQAVKTDTFGMSGTTFTDVTGLSVSITPTSTSNKILVMCDVGLSSSPGEGVNYRILRNGSAIYVADVAGSRPVGLGQQYAPGDYTIMRSGGIYLDSPSTTSVLTYKFQIASTSTGYNQYVNRTYTDRNTSGYDGRGVSSITVMEIAG